MDPSKLVIILFIFFIKVFNNFYLFVIFSLENEWVTKENFEMKKIIDSNNFYNNNNNLNIFYSSHRFRANRRK